MVIRFAGPAGCSRSRWIAFEAPVGGGILRSIAENVRISDSLMPRAAPRAVRGTEACSGRRHVEVAERSYLRVAPRSGLPYLRRRRRDDLACGHVMNDTLLADVLDEASLSLASRSAIAEAYPTLDDVLSATLAEVADVAGDGDASRLWEVLERRWRSDASGDLGQAASRLGQLIETTSADERPTSLRVQLRVLALLDVTMRAAGFDPDVPAAEDA